LLPSAETPALGQPAGQSAFAVSPDRREAAEDLPFTETWEFRAMVAEAVVKAMPQIIGAALTGHTS